MTCWVVRQAQSFWSHTAWLVCWLRTGPPHRGATLPAHCSSPYRTPPAPPFLPRLRTSRPFLCNVCLSQASSWPAKTTLTVVLHSCTVAQPHGAAGSTASARWVTSTQAAASAVGAKARLGYMSLEPDRSIEATSQPLLRALCAAPFTPRLLSNFEPSGNCLSAVVLRASPRLTRAGGRIHRKSVRHPVIHLEADVEHIVRGIVREGLAPARSRALVSLRVDEDALA